MKLLKSFLSNNVNLAEEALSFYRQANAIANNKATAKNDTLYGADEIAEELENIFKPLVNKVNLLDEIKFQKLLANIINWYPANLPPEDLYACGLIQQVLQNMLPKAQSEQRKTRLGHACHQYQRYLEQTIERELLDNYSHIFKLRTNINKLINSNDKSILKIKSENDNFNMLIEKYKAMRDIHSTLTTAEEVNVQLRNFKNKLTQHRPTIEKRRDNAAMIFLKVATTILSLGFAALFGIWNTNGKIATKNMESLISPSCTLK